LFRGSREPAPDKLLPELDRKVLDQAGDAVEARAGLVQPRVHVAAPVDLEREGVDAGSGAGVALDDMAAPRRA
jgi:hypothetical protein